MTVLLAKASGLLTASTTWSTVDATSYLNAENGSEVLTTAYSDTRSSTFAPGAITIDRIAVKLSVRTGVTGTISVSLYNDTLTADVIGTEVTIDVADLPVAATADLNGGWILFKLAAPVLLLDANNYRIQAKTSSASQVSLFRNATADNISRALGTTTEAAPGAGDDMIICGEKTGAGAETAITVTMDSEAATDYGAASTSLVTPALAICDGGTLLFGTTAATNYVLRLSGHCVVYSGGTYNDGTTGTPMPRNSSGWLEFDVTGTDGDFGFLGRNGSTVSVQGLSRTVGKLIDRCLLNTDEAVNSTSLGVSADTGWLDNDEIAVASTTRTRGNSEKGTLNGNAAADTLTVDGFAGAGGGLAAAHSGTAPTQAEVILLTRNVGIRSVSATVMAYVCFKPTAIVDIDWAEFYRLGQATTDKRALDVQTTTGSFDMRFSSVHDCEDGGLYVTGASANNVTFSDNVMFNAPSSTTDGESIILPSTSQTSITIESNIIISPATDGISSQAAGAAINNNIVVGAGTTSSGGFNLNVGAVGATFSFSGNTAHSCGNASLNVANLKSAAIEDFTGWRCTAEGITIGTNNVQDLLFDGGTLFGNTTANILMGDSSHLITFKDYILNGDSTFATTNGVQATSNQNSFKTKFISCDFSTAAGIKTAHTNDFIVGTLTMIDVVASNCKFGAATFISGQAAASPGLSVRSQKHNQVAADHRAYFMMGTIALDSTTFHTAAPSEKLTPNNASSKLESGVKKYAVASGGTVTASVWVLKDGAYNGNAPRLVLKANPAAGIAADVVLDTHSVAHSNWEQLSGTSAAVTDAAVLSVVVDCDGTAGSVFCDDYGT